MFIQLNKWCVHCSKDNYMKENEATRKSWVVEEVMVLPLYWLKNLSFHSQVAC
jgi:hypothetical protein